jgi:hypothetical protein
VKTTIARTATQYCRVLREREVISCFFLVETAVVEQAARGRIET